MKVTSSVDLESPDPFYRQIAGILRARIEDGTYRRMLPSEPALVEEFDVSRNTVRAALQALADDGLVLRVRGKGTYVARPSEP